MNTRKVSYFLAVFGALSMVAAPVFAMPRTTNDPFFHEQWYLQHIGIPNAWNTSLGFEGITVAVIDSGVDIDHPDLRDNIWRNHGEVAGDGIDNDGNGYIDDVHGWDFIDDDGEPMPDVSVRSNVGVHHGTISAGLIAARGDNGIGLVGVTWQTTIMPKRVLNSEGVGDRSDIVRAVEYAVNNGAKIINLSFAGATRNNLLRDALESAYNNGVFIVAAAGNAPEGGAAVDLDKKPLYPVCLDAGASENFIYGVAAVNKNDERADFSNYGAGCIDGAAPGTRVVSTQYHDPNVPGYEEAYGGYFNGTSIAAPIVAGVAALMKAVDPTLTPKQITNIFTETSFNIDKINPGYFGKLGRGRIEAAKAVQLVGNVEVDPEPVVQATNALLADKTTKNLFVTTPGEGREADVRLFTEDGLFVRGFKAYPEGFMGGASLAVAKFSSTGARHNIVTGAGNGGSPHVRVFDINTRAVGSFFAYDERFTGGVNVAVGDVNGDGIDEIITGAGPGGGPHVRYFNQHGGVVGGFFPFPEVFRGGVDVAAADVDGDGRGEIVTASGRGMVTTVRVFNDKGVLESEFTPYGPYSFEGATVRTLDFDGDGVWEIEVRRREGKDAKVTIFTATGEVYGSFDPITTEPSAFGAEINGLPTSTPAAVVIGALPGNSPLVTPYGITRGTPTRFYAYEPRFMGGVTVEVLRIN